MNKKLNMRRSLIVFAAVAGCFLLLAIAFPFLIVLLQEQ